MTAARAVAVWTGPVLVTAVAARVFAGDPLAPTLVAAAVLAPLVALLRAPAAVGAPAARGVGTAAAGAVTIAVAALLVWADLLVLADVARALGLSAWHGPVVAGALVMLATLWPIRDRGAVLAAWLGLVALAAPLAIVAGPTPPWQAWHDVALRPAFVFADGSPWVTDGGAVAAPTALVFGEPHRMVAAAPGVFRVVERERDRVTVREWRLGRGDGLTLRPGDELVMAPGARVRFEAGKRVPGAPRSGVTWADPPARRRPAALVEAAALATTFVAGAAALVRRPAPLAWRAAVGAPALALAAPLAAALLGVYAVWAAPELALGAPPSLPLVALPRHRAVAAGALLAAALAAGLLALFAAAACGLRDRVAEVVRAWAGDDVPRARTMGLAAWAAVLTAAVAAALSPADAWRVLLAALSLGACLTAAEGAAGVRPVALAAGVAVVAGGLAFGSRLPGGAALLGAYPALVAVPLAWALGRVAARRFR